MMQTVETNYLFLGENKIELSIKEIETINKIAISHFALPLLQII